MQNPFYLFSEKIDRPLRTCQKDVLDMLWANWDKSTFAIEAPVGSGKSLIALSVLNHIPKTRVLTNANYLVDQYYKDYSEYIEKFYGLSNYTTREEYQSAKSIALTLSQPIVTNTIAHLILSQDPNYVHPEVLIIDECDASIGLLAVYFTNKFLLLQHEIGADLFTYNNCINYLNLKIEQAEDAFRIAESSKRCTFKKYSETSGRVSQLKILKSAIEANPELFCIWEQSETFKVKGVKFNRIYLHIRSLNTPEVILRRFLGYTGKVILMSGTLFKHEIPELLPDRKYVYFSVPSPIEPIRRQILVEPTQMEMTYPRKYDEIAKTLDATLEKYKHLRPCLIHVSYNDAKNISCWLKTPHLVYEDKIDKAEIVEQFMKEKGDTVLLGPGLSVGIDLKHDLCRLNIIPILKFPNIRDNYVEKRLAQPFGRRWYASQTIRETVQSAGRSTRALDDYSLTVITDNRFSRFFNEFHSLFPESFKEALVFSERLLDKTYIGKVNSSLVKQYKEPV